MRLCCNAVLECGLLQGSRVTYGDTEGVYATWDAERLFGCYCDGTPSYTRLSSLAVVDVGLFTDYQCSLRTWHAVTIRLWL